MRRLAAGLAFAGALATAGQAAAWGGPGHQLTGAIADQLLKTHPNAAMQVAKILGMSLEAAAPWADCARSVNKVQGVIQWAPAPNVTIAKACKAFLTKTAEQEMVTYAAANWDQCPSPDKSRPCHTLYHFADIPEADRQYSPTRAPGATPYDVVHTINAAVAKLEGKTPPAPYAALTDRQALFLLAHMVGDLHQPLHVGSVYLDPNTGARLDPPALPPKATLTIGGNAITYNKSTSLHSTWDTIPDGMINVDNGAILDASLVPAAAAQPATPGDFHTWAAAWASDTVAQAHSPAFQAMLFSGKKGADWPISDKPGDYATTLKTEQRLQIVKGGRHLADLLVAIWPDNAPAPPSGQPGPKPKKPKTPKPPPGGGAPA
jgi:hypothetical protein